MLTSVAQLAHAKLLNPSPREPLWVRGFRALPAAEAAWLTVGYPFQQFEPVTRNGKQLPATSFRCKKFRAAPPSTTLVAGNSTRITWFFQATHPGDCSLYISYDGGNKDEPEHWIKLFDFPGCTSDISNFNMPGKGSNTVHVVLPSWLPSCEHCVMRWEYQAIHDRSNIQQYVDCADVTVVGTSEAHEVFTCRVTPITAISDADHLCRDCPVRYYYSRGEGGPQVGAEFMHGPAIARYNDAGCVPPPPLSPHQPPSPNPLPSTLPPPPPSPHSPSPSPQPPDVIWGLLRPAPVASHATPLASNAAPPLSLASHIAPLASRTPPSVLYRETDVGASAIVVLVPGLVVEMVNSTLTQLPDLEAFRHIAPFIIGIFIPAAAFCLCLSLYRLWSSGLASKPVPEDKLDDEDALELASDYTAAPERRRHPAYPAAGASSRSSSTRRCCQSANQGRRVYSRVLRPAL